MKLKTIDLIVKSQKWCTEYTLIVDISENSNEEKANFLNDMFEDQGFSVKKIKDHVHLTYQTYDKKMLTSDEVKEFLENITITYMVMISNKNEILEKLSEFYLKYNEFT